MTHPFHPLHGREFELIEITKARGMGWVYYMGEDGSLKGMPRAWTDVAAGDPFVKVGAGRSAFRVSDLLALAALLDVLDGGEGVAKTAVDGPDTVKEILPHV